MSSKLPTSPYGQGAINDVNTEDVITLIKTALKVIRDLLK